MQYSHAECGHPPPPFLRSQPSMSTPYTVRRLQLRTVAPVLLPAIGIAWRGSLGSVYPVHIVINDQTDVYRGLFGYTSHC